MSDRDQETIEYGRIGRRELLRTWGPAALVSGALVAAGATLHGREGRHRPPDEPADTRLPDWRIDPAAPGRIAVASGHGPAENVRRAVGALGGIEVFIRPGDTVAIKPNCAWDRTPAQAANTDPNVVAELVRLCLAAGAAAVTVIDNSCHDPKRTFDRSGIGPMAREAGATVLHQGNAATTPYNLGGTVLGTWKVLRPIAEADRLINVPVVKHHSLSRVTLGMKNWMGAIVGGRGTLHQRISQSSAELGAAFRPTLTVVDATRILTGGGPTGGSLELVRAVDRVAATTDPVAADAWGAELLEIVPEDLPHLAIASRLGLGSTDWRSRAVEL